MLVTNIVIINTQLNVYLFFEHQNYHIVTIKSCFMNNKKHAAVLFQSNRLMIILEIFPLNVSKRQNILFILTCWQLFVKSVYNCDTFRSMCLIEIDFLIVL